MAGGRIEPRPIQRVSHFSHQPACRISRQPGIRIKCDDVPDIRWNDRAAAVDLDESRVRCAAQQLVQFVEFAALALPAHPLLLPAAPHPPPMKQHKSVPRRGRSVQMIQSRDAFVGDGEQRGVSCRVLGRCIRPVRKQREVQLGVRRSEMVDLEAFDVFLDGRASRQKYGHHDHGAQMRWDAFA